MRIVLTVLGFALVSLIGNAGIKFDGSNDYVNCGADSSLNITTKITLAAWVKPLYHRNSAVITKRNTNDDYSPIQYEMGIWGDGTVHFVFYNGGYRQKWSAGTVSRGEWLFVAVTFSNPDVRIYIDGVLDTSATIGYDLVSDPYPVAVGDGIGPAAGIYAFDGIIEDATVWEEVLSSNEIRRLYEARLKYMPLQVRPEVLRLYLPCDDLEQGEDLDGATIIDLSGNGNHGTGNDADSSGGQGYGAEFLVYPCPPVVSE